MRKKFILVLAFLLSLSGGNILICQGKGFKNII